MTIQQNNKITIPLLQYGLPLSIKSNILIVLSLLPYPILYFFFKDFKLVNEAGLFILGIPALITFIFLRYKLSKKEHPNIEPIIFLNGVFNFPSNLFKNKQQINININQIQNVLLTEIYWFPYGRSNWKLIIFDNNHRKIKINWYSTELKKIEKIFMENGIKVTKKLDPIFLWAFYIAVILALYLGYVIFSRFFL